MSNASLSGCLSKETQLGLAWVYPPCGKFAVSGADVVEDNFSSELSPPTNIFLRELVQNSLDARPRTGSGAVRISLREITIDESLFRHLFTSEFMDRLDISERREPGFHLDNKKILVVEDFGTTGLSGEYSDENREGENEHWNAFWFREGEGTKAGRGSNGSAGQGKITFYKMSLLRSVICYTVRLLDGARLIMGRSHFSRDYPKNGQRFRRHSFLSSNPETPCPLRDGPALDRLVEGLGFSRRLEPGLSIAIPCPGPISECSIIMSLVSEFYYPIKIGKLVFQINEKEISDTNVDSYANSIPDEDLAKLASVFTRSMRQFTCQAIGNAGNAMAVAKDQWNKSPVIDSDCFDEGVASNLATRFAEGAMVAVRFPVTVSTKGDGRINSFFEVYLQAAPALQKSEEAYIRKDLVIGLERHISGSSHFHKARAITHIHDAHLSAFLSDAEEATHLKWNSRRKRLVDKYKSCEELLRSVRQAAPRLLNHLSGMSELVDRRSLSSYFPKPGDPANQTTKRDSRKKKPDQVSPDETTSPPPHAVKHFRIVDIIGGVRVVPNASADWGSATFPFECKLEMAYIRDSGSDPFRQYHPLDFDIGNNTQFPITMTGSVDIISRTMNIASFEVTGSEFSLEITGFDPHLSIKQKLRYKEGSSDEVDQQEG